MFTVHPCRSIIWTRIAAEFRCFFFLRVPTVVLVAISGPLGMPRLGGRTKTESAISSHPVSSPLMARGSFGLRSSATFPPRSHHPNESAADFAGCCCCGISRNYRIWQQPPSQVQSAPGGFCPFPVPLTSPPLPVHSFIRPTHFWPPIPFSILPPPPHIAKGHFHINKFNFRGPPPRESEARPLPAHKMRALHFLLVLLAVPLLMVAASPMFDTDMPQGRFYRALWNMNPKRSPSIGLSLAEYMAAGNQGHDQFHFIPSRK